MAKYRYVGGSIIKAIASDGTIRSIVDNIVLMNGGWDSIDALIVMRDKESGYMVVSIWNGEERKQYVYEEVKDEVVSKGV